MMKLTTSEKYPYYFNRLILGIQYFMGLSIGFLIIFLLFRGYEFLIITSSHHIPAEALRLYATGIMYDLLLCSKIISILFLPVLLLYVLLDYRVVTFLYIVIAILLLSAYLALIQYFTKTLIPLGADLFGYSDEEIRQTVGASGVINIWMIIPYLALIIVSWYLMNFFRRLTYPVWILCLFLIFIFLSFLPEERLYPQSKNYKTDMEFFVVSNKLGFFKESTQEYLKSKDQFANEDFYFDDEISIDHNKKEYVDPQYPFLRIDHAEDVLGNFFDKFDQKPNLVFIIVESLGKAYSGKNAYLGSFTPFLDSLAASSLYWENCLSAGGRTFAVLPTIFASLPFAEKGFLEMGQDMPPHQSLIKILKNNNYYAGFYNGGQSKFDNMNLFLQMQGTSFILEENNFGGNYRKMPVNDGGFTWGYGDLEVFKRYFELSKNINDPRLEIFLTVSNHDPFRVNGQEKYNQLFEKRMDDLKLSENEKEEYRKYREMYSCIMYSDDAIRYFINRYRAKPDFNNTIFIITGDHRMPEIPIATKIDKFHVPLLIYSPKINRPSSFASVSTHFDITPSLLAFLKKNCGIQAPSLATWIGDGLDTARNFRNQHSAALMRNKNELLDYIDKQYFLSGEQLFLLQDQMQIEPLDDKAQLELLQREFNEFKSKNRRLVGTKLMPDSIASY